MVLIRSNRYERMPLVPCYFTRLRHYTNEYYYPSYNNKLCFLNSRSVTFAWFVFQFHERAQKTILTRDLAGNTCSFTNDHLHISSFWSNYRSELTGVLESFEMPRSPELGVEARCISEMKWYSQSVMDQGWNAPLLSGLSFPGELQWMNGSGNEDLDSYKLICFTQPKGMYSLTVVFNLISGETCRRI